MKTKENVFEYLKYKIMVRSKSSDNGSNGLSSGRGHGSRVGQASTNGQNLDSQQHDCNAGNCFYSEVNVSSIVVPDAIASNPNAIVWMSDSGCPRHIMFATKTGSSMCKTKSTKVPDEDGVFEPIENLDSKLRTFLLQYVRSQYETNFLESLTGYSFARLKQCVYNLPEFKARKIDGRKQFPKSKREIHAKLSASYYKGEPSEVYSALLKRFPTLPHAGIKDLQKEPWRYVHAFFRVQNFLVDSRAKSFRLFPVARVERKHYVYDARALHELARRLEPANIPSWPKFVSVNEDNADKW
ncbi:hypothetical protein V9T40_000082 [Parthenolecanium corni]|uniref:Uncharacterized protein n=1 Tax=Parthenolecanium corni TaxID=536013 RepID=A0AAN9Y2K6_9HEMI